MPGYKETIGEQLQRTRLEGPKVVVRRGKLPQCKPKRMPPSFHIAIAEGPSGRHMAGIVEPNISIPEQVLADRDRRMAMQPHSLTAALMGDPPAADWHKRA